VIEVRLVGAGECDVRHAPSGAQLRTSKSPAFGGLGRSFSSTDLIGAALGSCIATDLEPVAARNGLALADIAIRVDKQLGGAPKRIESFTVTIVLPATVDDVLMVKLERAARLCLVQRSLSPDIACTVAFTREARSSAQGER
jgi:uncharacterized OsmC-like protein